MYNLKIINKECIKEMTESYYTNLIAPMDDMWELGIIGKSNYFIITDNKETENQLGYYVIDDENNLLQFYLKDKYQTISNYIFNYVLQSNNIKKANVSTYEPKYLSLCLDKNTSVTVNTLLYIEKEQNIIKKPIDTIYHQQARLEDLDSILEYNNIKIGDYGDWLQGYCKDLIAKEGLILYKIGGNIIGTGEIRPSTSNNSYANIGMTVSKDFRNKNIATYIISQMKLLANNKGLKAICSTTIENIASQRAIEKNGFYAYHRILDILF